MDIYCVICTDAIYHDEGIEEISCILNIFECRTDAENYINDYFAQLLNMSENLEDHLKWYEQYKENERYLHSQYRDRHCKIEEHQLIKKGEYK